MTFPKPLYIVGWLLIASFACIGIIAMTDDSEAAVSFKLKDPAAYYSDHNAVALLNAALAGDGDGAKRCISKGGNPNEYGPRDDTGNGLSLLEYAIAAGNAKAVRILVSLGADPELVNEGESIPFVFAVSLQRTDILSVLLELRPVPRLHRKTVYWLLFTAANKSCRQCLDILIKHGVPIDLLDKAGNTILLEALDSQDYDLAEWILLHGGSATTEARSGITPAYSVQYDLARFNPGTPTYKKVQHLKELMQQRGARFPAPRPEEVRKRRMGK